MKKWISSKYIGAKVTGNEFEKLKKMLGVEPEVSLTGIEAFRLIVEKAFQSKYEKIFSESYQKTQRYFLPEKI